MSDDNSRVPICIPLMRSCLTLSAYRKMNLCPSLQSLLDCDSLTLTFRNVTYVDVLWRHLSHRAIIIIIIFFVTSGRYVAEGFEKKIGYRSLVRAVRDWQGVVMQQYSVIELHQHRNSLHNRKAPSLCHRLTLTMSTKPSCSKTELKRCTTTEIRWNKNKDARTSPVVSTNRQLPNSLKNRRCIPVDWAVELHRNRDEFTLWWESSIPDHLVRCRQLGYSACLARSFQVGVGSCARHRHIPYERYASAPQNQCQFPLVVLHRGTGKAGLRQRYYYCRRCCCCSDMCLCCIRRPLLYCGCRWVFCVEPMSQQWNMLQSTWWLHVHLCQWLDWVRLQCQRRRLCQSTLSQWRNVSRPRRKVRMSVSSRKNWWAYSIYGTNTCTVRLKKRPPFYILNNSGEKWIDFNSFWCTESWGNWHQKIINCSLHLHNFRLRGLGAVGGRKSLSHWLGPWLIKQLVLPYKPWIDHWFWCSQGAPHHKYKEERLLMSNV